MGTHMGALGNTVSLSSRAHGLKQHQAGGKVSLLTGTGTVNRWGRTRPQG